MRICYFILGLFLSLQITQAVNIWPDKVRPTIELDEALSLAKQQLAKTETETFYAINATLLADDENGNTNTGYWRFIFDSEIGIKYDVAVRMDGRLGLQRIKRVDSPVSWPDTITPPISAPEAYQKVRELLAKEKKTNHYCLNATLLSDSNDVMEDGLWNFVMQSESDDPQIVTVFMDGKARIKELNALKQL